MLACDTLNVNDLFGDGGLLDEMQGVIDSATFVGRQIPLVGEQLADAVPFGTDIRQELQDAYTAAGGTVQEALESAFNEVLGAENLGFLQNVVTVDLDAESCTATATIDLSRSLAAWETPGLQFDVGLKSLPIYATGDLSGLQLEMGFDLTPFTLELDLNTGDVELDTTNTSFSVELNAGFADDASMSAQVGFLYMQISDGLGEFPADDERSGLELGVGVDFGPNFSVEETTVTGNADLLLHMQTEVNENLPSIGADFILHYDLTSNEAPEARFDNVSIGLGDMASKFLGPIIDVVEPIIQPLDFVTDLLDEPIPLISDLGLGDISVLQIANSLAGAGALPPDITAYVKIADAVAQIIDFVAMFEAPECTAAGCSDVVINLGDLSLSDINGDLRQLDPKFAEPNLFDASISSISVGQIADLGGLIDRVDELPLPDSVKDGLSSSLQNVNDQLNNGVSINFPIIDNPAGVIFQWLVGQNADIFTVDASVTLGESNVDLGGPMPVGVDGGLRGGFAPSVILGLGYDSFGVRRFVDNVRNDNNPSGTDFLDGFYITGDTQLSVKGFLEAYVELNALVFSVEASGGIRAGLLAEVIDSTEDPSVVDVDGDPHKVRFLSEMGPCAFHVAGDVNAGISLTAKVGIELGPVFIGVQHRWDIAEATIASFDTNCIGNPFQPPVDHELGAVDDNGVLTLFAGPESGQRTIEAGEINEEFTLVPVADNDDGGTGQSVRINAFGVSQVVHNVTQIVADMGNGHDKVTIADGITADVNIQGGSGDDVLRSLGSGTTTLWGGDGADQLQGGVATNFLYGGDGPDVITGAGNPAASIEIDGGNGDDLLFGGLGTNAIQGGGGNDQIVAGPGFNEIDAGPDDDTIVTAAGSSSILGGDGDDVVAWAYGNGSVVFDGGMGSDSMGMVGSSDQDTFVLTHDAGAVRVMGPGPAGIVTTTSANVERVSVDGLQGTDRILVQPLTGTPLEILSINLSDNLARDYNEDLISIHGTPIRDELTVETLDVTLSEMEAHQNDSRGGVMRISGFRSDPLIIDNSYEILAMNQQDRIIVNSQDANDLLTVRGVTGPTWIDTASGNDEIEVIASRPPNFANEVGDYLSEVTIDGGAGTNRLSVSESLTQIADEIEVTDRTVSSTLLPGVNYRSLEAGSFGQGISVTAGEHDDTVNVLSTRRGAVTRIVGLGGNDDLNVSSDLTLPGGNLDQIHGPLILDGGTGHTVVALVDTTDLNPGPLTELAEATIKTPAGLVGGVKVTGFAGPDNEVAIQIVDQADQVLRLESSNNPSVAESFLLHSSILGETIINDQQGDAHYTIEHTRGPLHVIGAAGDERIDVTPTTQVWEQMLGTLTVETGSGDDRVEIHDQGTGELTFYELTANSLSRGPAYLGTVMFDDQLETIELSAAAASDTLILNQLPTVTELIVDQGAGDNAIVGPSIGANWVVDGADSGSINGQVHFAHTATLLSSGGPSTFSIHQGGSISGRIQGSNSGHDVLDFTDFSTAVSIDMEQQTATRVAEFAHIDEFWGGSAEDTLVGPAANVDWFIDGSAQGSLETNNGANSWSFTAIERLVGNDLSDRFVINPTGELNAISGGAGTDTLDYSNFTDGVEVDLQAGTATNIDHIDRIENVTGGAGDDLLQGNAANNALYGQAGNDLILGRDGNDTLFGQAGNDMLIGGSGSDSLVGGDQSDLLIGGSTTHDANRRALLRLHSEWKRDDQSYKQRILNLRNGSGLNAPYALTNDALVSDQAIDQLFGGNDNDWFWADAEDVLLGLQTGEQVN